MAAPDGYPFALAHKACGETALYTKEQWYPGIQPLSTDAIMPDGTHPEYGSRPVCGSCGELIGDRTTVSGWKEADSVPQHYGF